MMFSVLTGIFGAVGMLAFVVVVWWDVQAGPRASRPPVFIRWLKPVGLVALLLAVIFGKMMDK